MPAGPACCVGRRCRGGIVALAILLLATGFAPVLAADPPPPVTDETVNEAIERAVRWLKAQRTKDGHWEPSPDTSDRHWGGSSGLALLSLLYAGEDPREAETAKAVDWLAGQTLHGTYAYGTRAHVLALTRGERYRTQLQRDLDWLLKAVGRKDTEQAGAYDYAPHPEESKNSRWDNSVTQYGVLGVWMAAEAGLDVPETYWELVAGHFLRCQNPDGGWSYQQGGPTTGSMTAAGLASLFVALDFRYAGRTKDAPGLVQAIENGLTWFGLHYEPTNPGGEERWQYYYLYGVERVGRAGGRKYFRERDWFQEGAAWLLGQQEKQGSWPTTGADMDAVRNTAFGLMFLCHGRAPLVVNKLQHGPDWDAQLRDAAGLTRYIGHTFERLVNWQIVPLDGPAEDLLESPVLYMYGVAERSFEDVEVQKLREYCERGGLLLAVAGGDGFRQSVEKLFQRAFPDRAARPVPDGHPLFNGEVWFAVDKPPLILEVPGELRTLALLSTRDLAQAWNRYGVKRAEADFQLAANVYLYATDKTTVRSRLQTPVIVPRETKIERTIKIARLRYDGPWDVEPYGWTRLGRYLNNEAATRLLVTSGVRIENEALKEYRIAHLTGTRAFTLSPDERKALGQFLADGGTLLADAAGGRTEFVRSLEEQLRAITQDEPRAVPAESFLMSGAGIPGGVDLAGTEFTRTARTGSSGRAHPVLRTFGARRRFSVIFSPLDITSALLGTHVYNVAGYEPDSALRIMRNLILYADLSTAEKARLHKGE